MTTIAKSEPEPHPYTTSLLRLGRGIGGLVLLSRRPTMQNLASGCWDLWFWVLCFCLFVRIGSPLVRAS